MLTLPGSAIPHTDWFDTIQLDKWIHAILFGGLCIAFINMVHSLSNNPTQKIIYALFITLFVIVYGVVIEFVQRDYIPNRSFDIWDIIADAVGSIGAFIWYWKIGAKKNWSR